MQFIDSRFPLFVCALIMFPLLFALGVGACSGEPTPEDKARALEREIKSINEDMIVIKPRPGVECYILKSRSVSVPRVMSCVSVPF